MTRLEDYRTTIVDDVVFSRQELKDVSTLHVLAVTDAPLKIVRHVHEEDPSALTEDVFLDACHHSSSLEVMGYLKEQVPPEFYTPQKIGPILIKIIKEGDEEDFERVYGEDEGKIEQLRVLSALFPEAIVYSEHSDNFSESPLYLVFCEDEGIYSYDLVEHMVQHIPSTIKGFRLPEAFLNPFVESLYQTIATSLARTQIEIFQSDEEDWGLSDFVEFFSTLLPAAKNLRTLELFVPGKRSEDQDLFAAFPTDWLKTSKISSLDLCLRQDGDAECNDFSILPWLVQMKELKNLKIQLCSRGQSADDNFCNTVCQVLSLGRLESLVIIASEEESIGLFLPLLDAIPFSCSPLSKFHLKGLKKWRNVDTYQNQMIAILKSNTSLEDVWIVSGRHQFASKEEKNQKVIGFFTTLNSCGRGMAINSDQASVLVKVLVKAPENDKVKTRLEVSQVLYGLLRESPGTWSANALDQDLINLERHSRGVKRKAPSLPERSSSLD